MNNFDALLDAVIEQLRAEGKDDEAVAKALLSLVLKFHEKALGAEKTSLRLYHQYNKYARLSCLERTEQTEKVPSKDVG